MITEGLVLMVSIFIGVGLVAGASAGGVLNGGLSRQWTAAGVTYTSSLALEGFLGFESFLRACWDGALGISGYLFVLSLGGVLFVWGYNLFKIGRPIQ